MRILLTGSTGRLGGAFLSLWAREGSGYDLCVLNRGELDLASPDSVKVRLDSLWREGAFDVIVNPAAVSGLEQCLDDPDLAEAVNVASPRVMAEFCAERGIRLVHFSTDYVFSGKQESRKSEADPVGPVNVYGLSKRAGELAVLGACSSALICRVSWLFGPLGSAQSSHFDQVIERALRGEDQRLIGDKYSVPTFTYDAVRWVEVLLLNGSSGIYHLCNTGDPESWLSYAQKVCGLASGYGYDVSAGKLHEMSLLEADFFREARPVHTAMLPARLINEGLITPRHWMKAAEEYLKMR